MKTLDIKDCQSVSGGAVFLAPVIAVLYSSSSITAGGLASAFGIGAGLGAITGGLLAIYGD